MVDWRVFIFGIDESNLGWARACVGFLADRFSYIQLPFHYTDSLRKRVEGDLTR